MLSKVLATLVAAMAVAFAGYTLVADSAGSKCCSTTMPVPAVTSDSCCETSTPSCCQAAAVVLPEASCADSCPADKIPAPAKDTTPVTPDGQ
jgi:hypothetical protein